MRSTEALRVQVEHGTALIAALSISLNAGKWRTSSVFCLCFSLTTGHLSTTPAMQPLFTLIIVWWRFVGWRVVGGVTVTGRSRMSTEPGTDGAMEGLSTCTPLWGATGRPWVTPVAPHTRTLWVSNSNILQSEPSKTCKTERSDKKMKAKKDHF